MLILTRRVGEKIKINNDIDITILSTDRNSVKIGIDAPKDVSIHREEIYERIQNENNKKKEKKENDESA